MKLSSLKSVLSYFWNSIKGVIPMVYTENETEQSRNINIRYNADIQTLEIYDTASHEWIHVDNDKIKSILDVLPTSANKDNKVVTESSLRAKMLDKVTTSTYNEDMSKKVDKVSGKVLSTNDFSNAYKSKLDSLDRYKDAIETLEKVLDGKSSTDTKNTAGSTNSTSKLYLIGATSQVDDSQTYSNSGVYIEDGRLYENSKPVPYVESFDASTGTLTISY